MNGHTRQAGYAIALLAAFSLAPQLAHAQERVAVSEVTTETDEVMAQLLTEALREAVLDAEDVRGAGSLEAEWVLRAEIRRASDDEDDRLHVSLHLVPRDVGRDERTLETTMSPDEPPANLRERARSFLDALFGTALVFRDVRVAPVPAPQTVLDVEVPDVEVPDAEAPIASSLDVTEQMPGGGQREWAPIAAWSSIGALAVSLAVVVGTQLRLASIDNDPRWQEARSSYSAMVQDICAENVAGGVPRSSYVADVCAEANGLELAGTIAMGFGAASLVSAVTFFVLEATADHEPRVSVVASPRGGQVGVSGRF